MYCRTEGSSLITYEGTDYAVRMAQICKRTTKALHDAGALIIPGTDMGNPYVFPGSSVHEELAYLADAGLTPYEALLASTRNAAECLNRLNEFGTVSAGKRADLILVEDNLLDDVSDVRNLAGEMVVKECDWQTA